MNHNLTGKKLLLISLSSILFAVALLHLDTVWRVTVYVFGLFSPIVLGLCIAFVLLPPAAFFERLLLRIGRKDSLIRRRISRGVAIFLTFVLILGLITLIVIAVVPQVKEAVAIVGERLPGMADRFADAFNAFVERYRLPITPIALDRVDWDKTLTVVLDFLAPDRGDSFWGGAVNAAAAVLGGVFEGLMAAIIAVYVLAARERVGRFFTRLVQAVLSEKRAEAVFSFVRLTNTSFRNFVTGQLLEALIIGVLCFFGMLLFRFPYAAATSAVICVTALVPVFGAWAGGAVGALFVLTDSPMLALLFIVYILVLQQLEGNLIYPKVVGTSMGLPGLLVLVAVLLGGRIGGVMGMLLGVPLCAVLYTLVKRGVDARLKKRQTEKEEAEHEKTDQQAG